MRQSQLFYNYNKDHREKFNDDLFTRTDESIIEELKKVILSSQRDKYFNIKVLDFKVVTDYREVNNILYNYEESYSKNKNKKKQNQFDYINLKDSDINLLIVKYYIAIKDEEEEVDVLIAIPRIVDDFYFRISGNIYSAMYQIVDGSTYNNSTSNSKKHSVTLKTMFMPIRIYRDLKTLKNIDKENIKCVNYTSRIFNKSLPAIKYLLARYGYYGTLNLLNINCIYITREPIVDDDIYTFMKKEGFYISVPKYIFNNDNVVQSFVYTIFKSINKDTVFDNLFTTDFWISSLGMEFNNSSIEKGLSILDSLEHLYDLNTQENIHLPEECKKDIYSILKWMITEFSALKTKDNLDISTKKIRFAEYIASLYAMKLSTGIYRVSDLGRKANIQSIKKAIMTGPMYLLSAISRCQLVTYRNLVNDMDSITLLKFTYKGISGLGDKSNKSVPNIYRAVNISHLGRVDPDSSSASDPGMSGTLCPLVELDNMSFSKYEEPNTWDTEFSKLMSNYRSLVGMREVVSFKRDILNEQPDKEMLMALNQSINTMSNLIKVVSFVDKDKQDTFMPLEEGGLIVYD